jgi:TetR/AcrR family transcriptional regulator, ethionamide resistance regulator
MSDDPQVSPQPGPGGRRRPGRPRDEANRRAILDAAENLLSELSLSDVRVAQIIDEAGVARGTFYLYFPSKSLVAAALVERALSEIFEAVRWFFDRQHDVPPREALTRTIHHGASIWHEHRVVLRTAVENWHSVPELAEPWLTFTSRFVDVVAGEIDRERAAGLAPPGRDSHEISAGLVHATVHWLYLAGLDSIAAFPSEEEIRDMILDMWLGVVYRETPEP